jgi:hypothetical protein
MYLINDLETPFHKVNSSRCDERYKMVSWLDATFSMIIDDNYQDIMYKLSR